MKHGHGNDGPATPAAVAHRGLDLFDHRHGWEDRDGGHHHDSGEDAPMVALQGRLSIRPAGSVRWQVGRLAPCPEAPTP